MSADKKSFILYHDIRTPLELLSDEERGKLFMAILDYSEFGAQPDFDGSLRMAFAFIQTAIDRDSEAWEIKREKRREAGSKGGKQRVANQANATFAKQEQANQAVPAPVPVPVNVPVPVKESKADKPPTRPYGQYGWVKLTDEQHAKLLTELGQEELERCIAYVDESAQATGNKNKWKDWNLVMRKCSREGWGRREDRGTTGNHQKPESSAGKRFNFKYDVCADE